MFTVSDELRSMTKLTTTSLRGLERYPAPILKSAMRPHTPSKVVSFRLIGTPETVCPVASWIILPLNWLSTPQRAEIVKRCRKSLGSTAGTGCDGVPAWTAMRTASVRVTSMRSPTLSPTKMLGSVVSSRRPA